MVLPNSIAQVQVTWGGFLTHGGATVPVRVTIAPSQTVTHVDTGTVLTKLSFSGDNGGTYLPATDQPGFIDSAGDGITGWHYVITLRVGEGRDAYEVAKVIQPTTAMSVIDLDLVPEQNPVDPPVVVVSGVTSVNGQTGVVTLTAVDVGADALGSASQALDDANDYTDIAIANMPEAPVTSVNGHVGAVVLNAADVGADVAGSAAYAYADAQDYTDAQIGAIPPPPVTSVAGKTGVVVLTKGDVGLGGVDNTTDLDKPISNATQSALDLKADLVAGKVPESQLPSFVDDVLEFPSEVNFPAVGESGKVYITEDTNQTYRWTGGGYARLSEGVVLGETSSTAYRGDRGKTAYDHTLLTTNPHGVTKAQVGLGDVENLAPADLPVSTATSNALAGKASTGDVTTLQSKTVTVVAHGVNASMARPTGVGAVLWQGSVEPTNRAPGDVWVETS